jgi:hypothetical protein
MGPSLVELPLLAAHGAQLARGLRLDPLQDAVHVKAVSAAAPHWPRVSSARTYTCSEEKKKEAFGGGGGGGGGRGGRVGRGGAPGQTDRQTDRQPPTHTHPHTHTHTHTHPHTNNLVRTERAVVAGDLAVGAAAVKGHAADTARLIVGLPLPHADRVPPATAKQSPRHMVLR